MKTKTDTAYVAHIWAKGHIEAIGLLAQPRDQAPRYATELDALAAKGAGVDGFPGERLFCITVEEIEA